MRTVKLSLALAVIAMVTTGAMAQDGQKKKGSGVKLNPVAQAMLRIEKTHETLKNIDLTEEQQGKLKELHKAIEPQMAAVMKQIAEILGEEKMTTAKETAKKAKEAGKTSRQIAVAVEAALKLTDEQQEKLAEVGKELTKIQRELTKKVSGVLTPEQKEKFTAAMGAGKKGGKSKKK